MKPDTTEQKPDTCRICGGPHHAAAAKKPPERKCVCNMATEFKTRICNLPFKQLPEDSEHYAGDDWCGNFNREDGHSCGHSRACHAQPAPAPSEVSQDEVEAFIAEHQCSVAGAMLLGPDFKVIPADAVRVRFSGKRLPAAAVTGEPVAVRPLVWEEVNGMAIGRSWSAKGAGVYWVFDTLSDSERRYEVNCGSKQIAHAGTVEAAFAVADKHNANSVYTLLMPSSPAPAASAQEKQTQAARDVLVERRRQIEKEGWDDAHDASNELGSMALAAASYAAAEATGIAQHSPDDVYARNALTLLRWPWARRWWKPKTPRRDLVRAAALILAEIELLDRRSPATTKHPSDHQENGND